MGGHQREQALKPKEWLFHVPSCAASHVGRTRQPCNLQFSAVARLEVRRNELCWVAWCHAWIAMNLGVKGLFFLVVVCVGRTRNTDGLLECHTSWFLLGRERLCMAVLSSTNVATISEDQVGWADTAASNQGPLYPHGPTLF